jgi:hypothetical protein
VDATLRRIVADYNELGQQEPDVIEIGEEGRLLAEGVELREGERVIVVEPGELEAVGVLFSTFDAGWQTTFWMARLDMSTLRSLDRPAGVL